MKNPILHILSLCILLCFTSCSQNYSVEKRVEHNPHFPDVEYTFPILHGPDQWIANKINSYLVSHQLDIELGQETNSIFENVWQKPDDVIARLDNLNYNVNILNSNFYSVTISGEFCSAYCEEYDVNYNFDLSTGSLLTLDDFLNYKGKQKLFNQLVNFKRTRLDSKITDVKQIILSEMTPPEHIEFYTDMLELYQNCNMEYDGLKDFSFVLSNDSIEIIIGRCSAHYNRAIDDLWDFKMSISLKEWSIYLSEMGKKTLNSQH